MIPYFLDIDDHAISTLQRKVMNPGHPAITILRLVGDALQSPASQDFQTKEAHRTAVPVGHDETV